MENNLPPSSSHKTRSYVLNCPTVPGSFPTKPSELSAQTSHGTSLKRRVGRRGFTIVELLVILAMLTILIAMLLPALSRPGGGGSRVDCANNLKQVWLSFRTWGTDNGGKYPMGVSTNQGGSMEAGLTVLTPHFVVMSNELSTPRLLVCPKDTKRYAATNFASLTDSNISFFMNIDIVDGTAGDIPLVGDGNLVNAVVGSRIVSLARGATLAWDEKVHQRQGNIAFNDGSVRQLIGIPVKTNMHLLLPPPVQKQGFWR